MTVERAAVELGALGFDGGAHVLVKLALADAPTRRARSRCAARHPELAGHLATWCRQQGHRWRAADAARPAAASASSSAARRPAPGGSARARRPADPSSRTPSSTDRPPTGASPRGARRSSRAARRRAFRLDRPRRGVDRPGPGALRPGGRRPVGPRHGDRLERRRSPTTAPSRHAVVQVMTFLDRERGGRARRARPLPRPGPPALPRDPAGPRRHRRRRGPPHRRVHPAGHDRPATTSRCPPSAAGPRCRRCSTSPTTPPPASCCR